SVEGDGVDGGVVGCDPHGAVQPAGNGRGLTAAAGERVYGPVAQRGAPRRVVDGVARGGDGQWAVRGGEAAHGHPGVTAGDRPCRGGPVGGSPVGGGPVGGDRIGGGGAVRVGHHDVRAG